jgi:DNA polymerase-1
MWREELFSLDAAPFDAGPSSLFIAFKAEADLGCMIALGWEPPSFVLDLYAEWRWRSNGKALPFSKNSLINVATYYGIDAMDAAAKDTMRQMFIDDIEFTPELRSRGLDYCEGDVRDTAKIYRAMEREAPFHLEAACYRGRYVRAATRLQAVGTPLDRDLESRFRANHLAMRAHVIDALDPALGVYANHSLSHARVAELIEGRRLPGETEVTTDPAVYRPRAVAFWPRTKGGRDYAIDKDTRKEMAAVHGEKHPWVITFRDLMKQVDLLETWALRCGNDGRNRYSVMPFGTKTGRNNPSSTEFIFALPAGLRPLIKPGPGEAVAYCDWQSMEVWIAAALSGDAALLQACRTGDPHTAFGIAIGMIPYGGTARTHKRQRKICKAALFGVLYGMGAHTLAARTGLSVREAQALLASLARTYPTYWAWSQRVVSTAVRRRHMVVPFDGWQFHVHAGTKHTAIKNSPMQSFGSAIMRLAAIAATEEGLQIGAVVHDAFLLVSTVENVNRDTAHLREIMAEAAERVVGVAIPVSFEIMRYPDRYWDADDPDAAAFWYWMVDLLERVEERQRAA